MRSSSSTAPETSAAANGGVFLHTGSWLMPFARIRSMVSRTEVSGLTYSSDGVSPRVASTSSMLSSLSREKPEVGHPLVVEHARQIAAAGVGVEHDDDVVGLGGLCDPNRGRDSEATGTADQDSFVTTDLASDQEAFLVADGDHLVVQLGLPGGRVEVFADTLDQVGPTRPTAEHRCIGIGGDRPGCWGSALSDIAQCR